MVLKEVETERATCAAIGAQRVSMYHATRTFCLKPDGTVVSPR